MSRQEMYGAVIFVCEISGARSNSQSDEWMTKEDFQEAFPTL